MNGSTAAKTAVRSVFVSDVHLGTRDAHAKQLNEFLKAHEFERLYLVGDIFDGWRMRSNIYWTPAFNRLLRRVLKLSKRGVQIVYITGNHDEFLRRFAGNRFENIQLCNRAVHTTADGRRLLVIHGDQFENKTGCTAWIKWIGDYGYPVLMTMNRLANWVRRRTGRGHFSLAGYLKAHLSRAQQHIEQYESAAAHAAAGAGYDGVVCGHIHHPATKRLAGVEYFNTGDWVENLSAIVERDCGRMELVFWPVQAPAVQLRPLKVA